MRSAVVYNKCMVKVVKKISKGDIVKTILLTIQAAGILSAALVAPNAIGAMEKLGILNGYKRRKEIINRSRDALLKSGFLKKDSNGFLQITEKGKEKLDQYLFQGYVLKVPRFWDKKWRVIIFDIPERSRCLRNKVRRTLISIGFHKIQNSVWVFPYDCAEYVALLKADFKIGKDVLYMEVDNIEGDTQLKKAFNLQ